MIGIDASYAALSDPLFDSMMRQLPDAEAWVTSCKYMGCRNAEVVVMAMAVFLLSMWRDEFRLEDGDYLSLMSPKMGRIMLAIGLCPDSIWIPSEELGLSKLELLHGALMAMHPLSLEDAIESLGIPLNRDYR